MAHVYGMRGGSWINAGSSSAAEGPTPEARFPRRLFLETDIPYIMGIS